MVKLLLIILTIACWYSFALTQRHYKDPSIIIIGAGPSGLAAATRLLENNFQNIVILEAESRIGGRVNSIKFGEAYLDLGAEWCHGQKDNIVYDLTKDLNFFRHTEYIWKLYDSSGFISDDFSKELNDINDSLSEQARHNALLANLTIGDFFIDKYKRAVHEKYSHDKQKLDIALDAMYFFLHSILSFEGAFSWYDPAVVNDYDESEGDQQQNWNGWGYKTILDILIKKIPDPKKQLPVDKKLILNKEVTNIWWDRQLEPVQVSCLDGSSYSADHVIFTPSVGVLKERGLDLFDPRLPAPKLEAINDIGLGAVMKVPMLFSSNWWNDEPNFNIVWSKEDKKTLLREFPEGPNLKGKSWLTNLLTIVKVERNPRVLVAWFTGDIVPAIELMPEENLVKGIRYTLDKFLGNTYRITNIENITRSQWYSNPHFRGSWSFQTLKTKRSIGGAQRSSEDDLAEPITDSRNRPLIQFAGEATSRHHYSTVHGAIETGHREADRIIHLYL